MTTSKDEYQQQIEEFLKQGGEISEIPQGKSGYVEGQSRSPWGAPRKRKPDVAPKPQTDK
jgi:hypothetical protein